MGDEMKRLLLLLLLVGATFAEDTNPPVIDLGPLLNLLTNLPGQIVDSFFTYVVSGLATASTYLTDATFKFIFASPDPNWFCAPYNGVMAILNSLYALVLMGLAIYFILRSNDVEGRLYARKWLENMFVMIIVLSFSFQLFVMLMDLNTYLANSLANQTMISLFKTTSNPLPVILALIILMTQVGLQLLTFTTLLLRYILMLFLLLLFPVAIFLYFIPPTQSWGRVFLKIILVFIFIPTADALVLLGVSAMYGTNDPNLVDTFVRSFALAAGFGAMGVVNLVLIILALLSIITHSKTITGVAGLALLKKFR